MVNEDKINKYEIQIDVNKYDNDNVKNCHTVNKCDDSECEKNDEEKRKIKEKEDLQNENESEDEDDDEKDVTSCDNCKIQIIFARNGYYVLTKEDEELCWCQYCFEKLWREMRDNLWECDDFEQQDDEVEEEEEI